MSDSVEKRFEPDIYIHIQSVPGGMDKTLDIGVLGYIVIVQHKEHSPEVFHIPPGTPCILLKIKIIVH